MEVKGFEKIVCITDFKVEKRMNVHSYCHLTALVKYDDADTYTSLVGKTTTVSHEGKNVFFGIVRELNIINKVSACYIETDIISVSTVIDDTTHTRVFQNEDKKLSDVINSLELNASDTFKSANVGKHTIKIVDSAVGSTQLKMPIVQLDETDFQFVLRLANFLGCSLWIDDIDSNSPTIYLGCNSSKKKTSIDEKDVSFYTKTRSIESTTYSVETNEVYSLGAIVTFKDLTGTVKSMVATLNDDSTYSFRYEIVETIEYPKQRFLSNGVKAYFSAKVTDNEDDKHLGRVKVSFKARKSIFKRLTGMV